MVIIPRPFLIKEKGGFFRRSGAVHCSGNAEFHSIMETVQQHFNGLDGGPIRCTKEESLDGESYRLDIKEDSIDLSARTSSGIYHGFQTIRQLLLSDEAIQCVHIEDQSRFAWRGFMLDTSRHFYSVAWIKKLLDALSLHHINRFHWHLTDDQGWRLPIKQYPLLTEIGSKRLECRPVWGRYSGGFYSHDDIRDIVAFAAARQIEIIPEVDFPGHASAILASYPGLGCTGGPYRVEDRHGIFEDVLCAGNDSLFDLAHAVFDTLGELFPSSFVHIGGDEVRFNRWNNCPKCQKRMHDCGLSSARALQSWITVRLATMLEERGKTAIGWDEVLEDSDNYCLPSDVIVMSWRGRTGGDAAVQRGHKVIMAPNTEGCYLDYRHSNDPEEPGQIGLSPIDVLYNFDPLNGIEAALHTQILGAQCNLWSELIYAGKIAEYMIFPRICACAEALWTPASDKSFERFKADLNVHQQRLDKLGLNQYRINA
ncbi:MAG: beta-N-acetylhexosaminidase [Treponema sp.]|jgi:hexosaminidase|nr:beta-N-acetylhexosaminidase [Treponema sp.]